MKAKAYPFATFTQRSAASARYFRKLTKRELLSHLRSNERYLASPVGNWPTEFLTSALVLRRDTARESFRLAKELQRRRVASGEITQRRAGGAR